MMDEAKEKELAAAYVENTKLQIQIIKLRQQIKDRDETIETLRDKIRELLKN